MVQFNSPDLFPEMELHETKERMVLGKVHPTVWMQHLGRYCFAVPHIAGKTVLDCACGIGYGTNIFSLNGAGMAIGVDLSEEAISFARRNYVRPNLQYFVMDAQCIAFPENTFDVIVSFETMEHLPRPESFLAGVVNCLRPEGIFITSVPNRDVLPDHVACFSPFHVREYNLPELRSLLDPFFKRSVFFTQPWHDQEQAYRMRLLSFLKRIKLGWLRAYSPSIFKKGFAKAVIQPMANRDNARLSQSSFEPSPVSGRQSLGENDSVLIAVCQTPISLAEQRR